MPRYFLSAQNIDPETYFSEVRYSGAHDVTATWVQDGKVAAGVANKFIVDGMYKDGRLDKNKVAILWETPTYPDYVWAAQSSLSKELQEKIKNSFMMLTKENEKHRRILELQNTDAFFPAHASNFSRLIEISLEFNLLESR